MNMSLSEDDLLLVVLVVSTVGAPTYPIGDSTAGTVIGPPHIVTSTPGVRVRATPAMPAPGWVEERGRVPPSSPSLAEVLLPSRVPAGRWFVSCRPAAPSWAPKKDDWPCCSCEVPRSVL